MHSIFISFIRPCQSLDDYIQGLLASFGQIFFQSNVLCGFYVVTAIGLSSPSMALGSVLGAAVAQWIAGYLGVDSERLRRGEYGFNGALLGLAGCYFYADLGLNGYDLKGFDLGGFDLRVCGLIVLASLLATLLQYHWMQRTSVAPYTAPFVLIAWLMLALFEPKVAVVVSVPSSSDINLASTLLNSISQVCLQQNPLTGLMILVGIALSSLRAAVWVLVAAVISLLYGWLLSLEPQMMNQGLYGFSPVLVALGCLHSQRLGRSRLGSGGSWLLLMLLLIPLSIMLWLLFAQLGMIALTAPFVMTLWLASSGVRRFKFRLITGS